MRVKAGTHVEREEWINKIAEVVREGVGEEAAAVIDEEDDYLDGGADRKSVNIKKKQTKVSGKVKVEENN